jgi:HEPN domain-containing protein
VNSRDDFVYRLKLAAGFLHEAREDMRLGRWRSCVSNSQLAVENAAKAVLALFGPVPRTHEVGLQLEAARRVCGVPEAGELIVKLQSLSSELGFDDHVLSDYGDEVRRILPWDMFKEEDAGEALSVAEKALSVAGQIGRKLGIDDEA